MCRITQPPFLPKLASCDLGLSSSGISPLLGLTQLGNFPSLCLFQADATLAVRLSALWSNHWFCPQTLASNSLYLQGECANCSPDSQDLLRSNTPLHRDCICLQNGFVVLDCLIKHYLINLTFSYSSFGSFSTINSPSPQYIHKDTLMDSCVDIFYSLWTVG